MASWVAIARVEGFFGKEDYGLLIVHSAVGSAITEIVSFYC